MIVQFADEKLLGLLLVAEAEQRNTASNRSNPNRKSAYLEKRKSDLEQLPQSFLIEVIPHV
jgi:hypothetical protein